MLRSAAAFCLLLCGAAHASGVTLLDGTKYPRARVQTVKGKQAILSLGTETTWEVPVRALLEDTSDDEAPLSSHMNLFLWNGDRMAGTVVGGGETVRLKFAGIEGFTVPLDRVRAVHFGRTTPTGTDLTYRAAFKKMRGFQPLVEGLHLHGVPDLADQPVRSPQEPFILAGQLPRFRHLGLAILVDHRQNPLRQVAVIVGQLAVHAVDHGLMILH